MRKVALAIVGILTLASPASAELPDPVKWSTTGVKKNNQTYEVAITAEIAPSWRIFSQSTEVGAVPTRIKFKPTPTITMTGKIKEVGDLKTGVGPSHDIEVKYYRDKVVFVQSATVKGKGEASIVATIEYMACNDDGCLPPLSKSLKIKLQ